MQILATFFNLIDQVLHARLDLKVVVRFTRFRVKLFTFCDRRLLPASAARF